MARTSDVREVTPSVEQSTLLQEWNILAEQLATIKNKEAELRNKLVLQLGSMEKLEGTENLAIGNGWVFKIVKRQNYTMENAGGQTLNLHNALSAIDPSLPSQLIKWQPEISIDSYKKILLPLLDRHPELKPLASAAIQIKPGMPQVELVPPKG